MTRPQMLTQSMVVTALSDSRFRLLCPEFGSVREPESRPVKAGCGKCGYVRDASSTLTMLFAIASGLSPDAYSRLKQYFNIKKLMLSVRDAKTKAVTLKVV